MLDRTLLNTYKILKELLKESEKYDLELLN